MSIYSLPQGIRIPNVDEYPSSINVDEINHNRLAAQIVQGYNITSVENKNYTHFIKANVDADKIWTVFVALANAILPDIAYGILGFKDGDDDVLSNYTYKTNIINILKNYAYELTNDGYLTFGIAFNDKTVLNEIFVSSFKYFKIWTNSISDVISVLNSFEIYEIKNLKFIDEFPVCSMALNEDMRNGVRHYTQVTEEIKTKFVGFTV